MGGKGKSECFDDEINVLVFSLRLPGAPAPSSSAAMQHDEVRDAIVHMHVCTGQCRAGRGRACTRTSQRPDAGRRRGVAGPRPALARACPHRLACSRACCVCTRLATQMGGEGVASAEAKGAAVKRMRVPKLTLPPHTHTGHLASHQPRPLRLQSQDDQAGEWACVLAVCGGEGLATVWNCFPPPSLPFIPPELLPQRVQCFRPLQPLLLPPGQLALRHHSGGWRAPLFIHEDDRAGAHARQAVAEGEAAPGVRQSIGAGEMREGEGIVERRRGNKHGLDSPHRTTPLLP